MICMVAIAAPSMAIDLEMDYDDMNQFQGGVNVYIENGAATIGDMAAASANIVAGQLSFQSQRVDDFDQDFQFCNKEEIYFRDYGNNYYNNDDVYMDADAMTNGKYELKGPSQEWYQRITFSTGYGMAEMVQQGTQNTVSLTIEQTPNLDLNGVEFPDYYQNGKDLD